MREAVANRPPPEGAPNALAAARALLVARAGYSTGSGEVMLAPYQAGAVSLVANALDGPMVEDVTSGAARLYLDEWEERMLRTDAEYQEMLEKDGTVEPYIDSTLKSSSHQYLQFINDFKRRCLLRWTRAPKERVGVFFVRKKDGKLRLIIDARRTNQRFRTPPGVALSSAEAFSDVECEPGQKVFISTTDVENCFYKMRISKELSAFFALPPVTAGSVGTSMIDEEILASDDLVYPCFSCLPNDFVLESLLCSARQRRSLGRRGGPEECD
jgi:hypothetical protein